VARPIKMLSRQESNPPRIRSLRRRAPMDIAEFQRGDEVHGFQGSWIAHFQRCKFNRRWTAVPLRLGGQPVMSISAADNRGCLKIPWSKDDYQLVRGWEMSQLS